MAHPDAKSSNLLFQTLEDWSAILGALPDESDLSDP
jgi:hypothetical protein